MAKNTLKKGMHLNPDKAKEMAARFRHARSLVGMTRTAFCHKYGINYHTLQSWEIARNISRGHNLSRFCDALQEEGVMCSEDWLLEGIDPEPYLKKEADLVPSAKPVREGRPQTQEHPLIQQEIAFFKKQHEKADIPVIVARVGDQAMSPDYDEEDYVGAYTVDKDKVDTLLNTTCLIEVRPRQYTVRRLLKEKDRYVLLPKDMTFPVMGVDTFTSVAEIVWHRRIPKL